MEEQKQVKVEELEERELTDEELEKVNGGLTGDLSYASNITGASQQITDSAQTMQGILHNM